MQISTDLNTCNVLYSMKENWPFVFLCYVFSMIGPSLTLECIYSGNNRSISLRIHHVNAMDTLTQTFPCFGLCWEGLCIKETRNSNLCTHPPTHPYMSLRWPSLFGHFALLYIAMRSFYMLLKISGHKISQSQTCYNKICILFALLCIPFLKYKLQEAMLNLAGIW